MEASAGCWVRRQRMPDGRVCCVGNGMLSVVAECDAAVYQVLWHFVVQTPVDCHIKLVPDQVCHVELGASQHVHCRSCVSS